MMLSVIIPAYNEEDMILRTSSVVCGILDKEEIIFELIFINDGSKDLTWEKIKETSKINNRIRGISFSRNFGKEAAIFAGLKASKGECAIVIDCDLQHPPEKMIQMYRLWESGYEIVEGVKASRGQESKFHSFAARCFYGLISKAIHIDMTHASDFKLLDRKAVNVLLNMQERNAFFRALSSWIGFKTKQIEYDVQEREVGESKWSTRSLIKYAITNITSFTAAPMQIVTILGCFLFTVCVILSIESLIKKITGSALGGFTTVIILQGFTSSIIMISLGIIGYYIAKIYDENKGRPRYIIADEIPEESEQKT